MKHGFYKQSRNDVHSTISDFILKIKPSDWIIDYFADIVLKDVWNARAVEVKQIENNKKSRLIELETKQKSIIDNLDSIIHLPKILEVKNKELESLEIEINDYNNKLKNEKSNSLDDINFGDFQKGIKHILKHLDRLAIKSDNQVAIGVIFDLIFITPPTYEELQSQTPQVFPIFAWESQEKKAKVCSFATNSSWYTQQDSNLRPSGSKPLTLPAELWVHTLLSSLFTNK